VRTKKAAGRLKKIIAAYRGDRGDSLDRHACDLLQRLATDSDAANAFATFNVDDHSAKIILSTCIDSDLLARTFRHRIAAEQGLLARLDRLDKAVAELRGFIDHTFGPPPDPRLERPARSFDRLSAFIYLDPTDVNKMRTGVYLIADQIAARRRVALETLSRIGKTRKSNQKNAGVIAAIGWLAEGVRRCSGHPHLRAVADLAQVVFGRDISIDQVRNAVRTRQREWRVL
jgi:hypothetical protein